MLHRHARLDPLGQAQVPIQHRQVDNILAVVFKQQIKRRTVAGCLVAAPEGVVHPIRRSRGGPPDPQQHLDALEAAAQPALAADMQQIAVLEIALQVRTQPLADDRQVEVRCR